MRQAFAPHSSHWRAPKARSLPILPFLKQVRFGLVAPSSSVPTFAVFYRQPSVFPSDFLARTAVHRAPGVDCQLRPITVFHGSAVFRRKQIACLVVTILLAAVLAFPAYLDLFPKPVMIDVMHSRDFPDDFPTLDETIKTLAVLALLVPGFPTLGKRVYSRLTFLTFGISTTKAHTVGRSGPSSGLTRWWRSVRGVSSTIAVPAKV